MKSKRYLIATTLALLGVAVAAIAVERVHARPALKTRPPTTLYTLSPESTYIWGCFGLCKCPIFLASEFGGTFGLEPMPSDDLDFSVFAVTDVDWDLTFRGQEIPISGSGTYEVGTIDGEPFHQLVLDLQFGDDPEAPIQTFDSGLVPGGESGEFPDIDISINEYDLQCLDTLIHVVAGPGPVKIHAPERVE
jgi:hypothetical protein